MTTEENASTEDVKPETPAPAAENAEPTEEEKAAAEPAESDQPSEESSEAKEIETPEPEPKHKKPSRAQERIKDLVARAKEADRVKEQAEARLKKAEARLARYEAPEPKPSDYELGEDDYRFVSDLAAFKAAQNGKTEDEQEARDAKADAEANAQQVAQVRHQTFMERANEFKGSAPDFEEVAFNQTTQISDLMRDIIVDSEYGPQLAYFLGKNPMEAASIAGMTSEREVARNLGRIEASFASSRPRQVTKAPTPIKPVATGGGSNTMSAAEMSVDDMEKHLRSKGVMT